MAQVGANMLDSAVRLVTGEPLGLVIPAYAEFTGFFLVAASFLALANALRAGSHIRVVLLIRGAGPRARHWIELWCTGAGALFMAYFTWFAVEMVVESYTYNDTSPGIVPVPIWIPQTSMAIGLVILTIALMDEFVTVLGGDPPAYAKGDEGELALIRRDDPDGGD